MGAAFFGIHCFRIYACLILIFFIFFNLYTFMSFIYFQFLLFLTAYFTSHFDL